MYSKDFLWIAVLLFLVLTFLMGDSIYFSLSDYMNADAGIMIRFEAIDFLVKQIKSSPWLGMGLLSSSEDSAIIRSLLLGTKGMYYRNDVEIIGFVNSFGIIGLIWVTWFFQYLYRENKNISGGISKKIINAEILYMLITLVNLSFMDPERTITIFIFHWLISDTKQNEIVLKEL